MMNSRGKEKEGKEEIRLENVLRRERKAIPKRDRSKGE